MLLSWIQDTSNFSDRLVQLAFSGSEETQAPAGNGGEVEDIEL